MPVRVIKVAEAANAPESYQRLLNKIYPVVYSVFSRATPRLCNDISQSSG